MAGAPPPIRDVEAFVHYVAVGVVSVSKRVRSEVVSCSVVEGPSHRSISTPRVQATVSSQCGHGRSNPALRIVLREDTRGCAIATGNVLRGH